DPGESAARRQACRSRIPNGRKKATADLLGAARGGGGGVSLPSTLLVYRVRIRGAVAPWSGVSAGRNEGGDAAAVFAVLLAEVGDEVMLFEADAHQDVKRHEDGKRQPAGRHVRSGPEADEESQHQRM